MVFVRRSGSLLRTARPVVTTASEDGLNCTVKVHAAPAPRVAPPHWSLVIANGPGRSVKVPISKSALPAFPISSATVAVLPTATAPKSTAPRETTSTGDPEQRTGSGSRSIQRRCAAPCTYSALDSDVAGSKPLLVPEPYWSSGLGVQAKSARSSGGKSERLMRVGVPGSYAKTSPEMAAPWTASVNTDPGET